MFVLFFCLVDGIFFLGDVYGNEDGNGTSGEGTVVKDPGSATINGVVDGSLIESIGGATF